MKILKKGKPPGSWTTECFCSGKGNGGGGCGAKLLVEESDLFITTASARDEFDFFVTFRCLDCKVQTDIPRLGIPVRVYNKILEEWREANNPPTYR